jgi:phospholipase/lecithinase/hemolysin
MNILNFYKKLTIVAAFFSMALFSAQPMANNQKIGRMVIFGASLSDTGNAFIWLSEPAGQGCGISLNVPPYNLLDDFIPDAPISDGPYATGGHHFTNGATWVEGLARYLGLAGNSRPAFQNVGQKASNYAVGGARAIADYPCRFNLPAQVQAYISDVPQTSPDTLVTIEIGANDVRDALVAGDLSIIDDALIQISVAINNLYANGARNFLIMNVPEIGKTPFVRILDNEIPGISLLADQLTRTFNIGLEQLKLNLNQSLEGISIKILDVYEKFNDVVANPGDYGFVNVADVCVTPNQPPFKCKKPDTYVFWDGIHPTKALHAIVAQQAIIEISAP